MEDTIAVPFLDMEAGLVPRLCSRGIVVVQLLPVVLVVGVMLAAKVRRCVLDGAGGQKLVLRPLVVVVMLGNNLLVVEMLVRGLRLFA